VELTGLGHSLTDLLDGYPATAVKGLLEGARLNRRRLMAEQAVTLTVAITGALDLAFNQGKGRVLEKWLEGVMADGQQGDKRPRMTDRAFSFFSSLPRKETK